MPGLANENAKVSAMKRLAQIADRFPGQVFRQFDYANYKLRATLTGHTGPIRSVDFSPDGTMLVSASQDEMVKLWDVRASPSRPTVDYWPRPVRTTRSDYGSSPKQRGRPARNTTRGNIAILVTS